MQNNPILNKAKYSENTLDVQNPGQLLVCYKLCNHEEAFLLSSAGLGSLDKVLNVLSREDLLDFGTGKRIKKIKAAKWDTARNTIDHHSIIPKM